MTEKGIALGLNPPIHHYNHPPDPRLLLNARKVSVKTSNLVSDIIHIRIRKHSMRRWEGRSWPLSFGSISNFPSIQ